ncbi:MAG: hypothetical protein NWP80_01860 [Candidatus Gracilibacteria bacterium]|nr:hypothetical protein [Candidatus Gracilibacteria bacterium]
MKKQYIFLAFIFIIIYLLFLIVSYKYKEYNTNYYIKSRENENNLIIETINKNKKLLEYYSTNAYKNKILKEEHGFINQGEIAIYITTENEFNKFTQENISKEEEDIIKDINIYDNMTLKEKWIYFITKKDIR